MEKESRSALKEWSAVEGALAGGRLSLLVRKGGIHEKRGGFAVEHRAFWIFPTGWHQNAGELRAELRAGLGPPVPRDEIALRLYCEVVDALRVESLEALERLEGLHPYTPETVRARFAYRGRPYLHVLVVRANRLPQPHVVPNTLGYEGCVSWVELDEALPTAGAAPVLPAADFDRLRADILSRLGTGSVVRL